MSFKIVKASTRLARMMSWFSGVQKIVTDLYVGGVTRSKLETVAVEMEHQDFQFYQALKKAIPIAIYRAFDFNLKAPVRASGNVTFTAASAPASDITIPEGFQVATSATATEDEKVYETTEATVLAAGETSVSVPVVCVVPGTSGNVGAGTIVNFKGVIAGVTSVTNAAEFANGRERETEAARQVRFREYVASLARGTAAAVAYGAKTAALADANGNIIEEALQAKVVDAPFTTAGFLECYIFNGVGSTSQDLVDLAQQIIDGYIDEGGEKVPGYKAAGIVATVSVATETSVDVTLSIEARGGVDYDDIAATAETLVAEYINELGIGEAVILAEITERVMGISGAYNVAISAPSQDQDGFLIGAVTHAGSGLDDMSAGGELDSGVGRKAYLVEIDLADTTDTFRWSYDDGESWEAEDVAITGAEQELENGVTITFAATTGHTLGDQWSFSVDGAVVFLPGTITATAGAA